MTLQTPSIRDALYQLRVPIIAILFTIAVGLVAMAVAYPRMSAADRDGFWAELGKAGMQTIVVAAVGGIVTAGLKYMEDQREAAQKVQDAKREEIRQRNEYRLGLLRRLRDAYSTIKRVRRELEIAGFKPASIEPFAPATGPVSAERAAAYHAGIAALREVKLDLEAMREELLAGIGLGESTEDLKSHLRHIEDYLDNQIIDEQRALPSGFTTADMPLDLNQVQGLQRFVAVAQVAFGAHVSRPYHEAARVLVNDILTPDPDESLPTAGKALAH